MKISVVIPCYNAAPYLGEALDSVLGQTYAAEEVIVVDDGSTDESAAIAEAYGPPVRVIRQENQGESVARNKAMDLAKGDWIALLDADDRWELSKLEKQVNAFISSNDEITCIYTDVYFFQGAQRLHDITYPESHSKPDFRAQMLITGGVVPTTAMVRAEIARRVRFPEEIRHAEDMIFFAQLRDHGPFLRIPEPLAGYRISSTNQSRAKDFNLKSFLSRYQWFIEHLTRYSIVEQKQIRSLFLEKLVEAHDIAYWDRQNQIVLECRSLFQGLFSKNYPLPLSFVWRLYPQWLMHAKDSFDRIIRSLKTEKV